MKDVFKSKRHLLIGTLAVLMPLAAANADDYSTPRYGDQPQDMQHPMGDAEKTLRDNPPAAGEQGPVRSDMRDEKEWSRDNDSDRTRESTDKADPSQDKSDTGIDRRPMLRMDNP